MVDIGPYVDAKGIERTGYMIRNKDTGVVEYTTQYLPDAINTCKGLLSAMEQIDEEGHDTIIENEIVSSREPKH